MTDYAITQTTAQSAGSQRFSLLVILRNWIARRRVKSLQDREDRILDDIGVTREEITWASNLPLSENAAHALEQASYRRRKEEQLKWL